MRAAAALVVAVLLVPACGDDGPHVAPDAPPPTPPATLAELPGAIRQLPGVTISDEIPSHINQDGYHYFVLEFTQPVDHDDPGGPTFQQEVSMLVHDTTSPLVVHTTGYSDYWVDNYVELTNMLDANQINIEHRYFAGSRPSSTDDPDWSKLTIAEMAADEHVILTKLHEIFPGKFITSGESKGGMTAVYHRRFYPDDVAGTVPYVAPLSFAAGDPRYATFLAAAGGDTYATCRQAVRDAALEMLKNRRQAMLDRATEEQVDSGGTIVYSRVAIGPAVESGIAGIEWAFWQYHGAAECGFVPPTTASDDDMWTFLHDVSGPSDSDDDNIELFEPYDFQADFQLGYPDSGGDYLAPYLMYDGTAYAGVLTVEPPPYDGGTAMMDVDTWLQSDGDRFLFVYGQWDPWSGGMFRLGAATDATLYVQPEGTHGSTIEGLADADTTAALATLARWSGVTPHVPHKRRAAPPRHHIPPAVFRARR